MNDTHDELTAGNETYYGNYAGQYIFVTPGGEYSYIFAGKIRLNQHNMDDNRIAYGYSVFYGNYRCGCICCRRKH